MISVDAGTDTPSITDSGQWDIYSPADAIALTEAPIDWEIYFSADGISATDSATGESLGPTPPGPTLSVTANKYRFID